MTKRAAVPETIVSTSDAETATAEPTTPRAVELPAVDRYEAGLPVTDEEREAIEALDEDSAKPPRSARKESATPKQKGKKNSERKVEPRDAGGEASALGESLAALAKEAGRSKEAGAVAAVAAKLAKGAPTHAQLVSLRDAVNALSASLREQGERKQVALAEKLSRANRAVRRLERAAR